MTTFIPAGLQQGTLAYPNVLRVTFAETPSMLLPDFLAADQLASDVGNVVANIGQVAGVAIASSTDVPPGAQAFTMDFAPTDPNAAIPVNQILAQIQGAMTGLLEFISNTTISQVQLVNASAATGAAGALARGTTASDVANQLAQNSFLSQLGTFLSSAENVVLVGVGVAALVYFAPEIKAGVRQLSAQRKRRRA